jgi:hypothetical protein
MNQEAVLSTQYSSLRTQYSILIGPYHLSAVAHPCILSLSSAENSKLKSKKTSMSIKSDKWIRRMATEF